MGNFTIKTRPLMIRLSKTNDGSKNSSTETNPLTNNSLHF